MPHTVLCARLTRHSQLECPAAEVRLLEVGRPATIPAPDQSSALRRPCSACAKTSPVRSRAHCGRDSAALYHCDGLAQARHEGCPSHRDRISSFQQAVDQLHPYISDILEGLNKVAKQMPTLPAEWEPRLKIRQWHTVLNKMKASDELSPEQIRQVRTQLACHQTTLTPFVRIVTVRPGECLQCVPQVAVALG